MSLPGASLAGGDERLYHDDEVCPVGQRIPTVRRNEGKGLKHCPTCAERAAPPTRRPHDQ